MQKFMWLPIESLPEMGRTMFVVKAINIYPTETTSHVYNTDPYCVWKDGDKFVRWPHPFQPTHYCLLP